MFPFKCESKLRKSSVEIKIEIESLECIDIYDDDCKINELMNGRIMNN